MMSDGKSADKEVKGKRFITTTQNKAEIDFGIIIQVTRQSIGVD